VAYNVLAFGILILMAISYLLNLGEAGLITAMVIYVIILGCFDKEEKDDESNTFMSNGVSYLLGG
jgi:hypothetical protein